MPKNERLEQAIYNKGLRQDRLAEMVGVTPQTITSWVSGKHKPTSVLIKKALAEVLGVDVFAEDTPDE